MIPKKTFVSVIGACILFKNFVLFGFLPFQVIVLMALCFYVLNNAFSTKSLVLFYDKRSIHLFLFYLFLLSISLIYYNANKELERDSLIILIIYLLIFQIIIAFSYNINEPETGDSDLLLIIIPLIHILVSKLNSNNLLDISAFLRRETYVDVSEVGKRNPGFSGISDIPIAFLAFFFFAENVVPKILIFFLTILAGSTTTVSLIIIFTIFENKQFFGFIIVFLLLTFGISLFELLGFQERLSSFYFRVLLWITSYSNYDFSLLGQGAGSSRSLTEPIQHGTVHSTYLSIFYEFGPIVFTFFLFLIYSFSKSKVLNNGFLGACFTYAFTHEFYFTEGFLFLLFL